MTTRTRKLNTNHLQFQECTMLFPFIVYFFFFQSSLFTSLRLLVYTKEPVITKVFCLDVEGIKYVINFDYPNSSEDYIHRIGRTGRSDSTGTSYAFFTPSNFRQAKDLISVLKEANQVSSLHIIFFTVPLILACLRPIHTTEHECLWEGE